MAVKEAKVGSVMAAYNAVGGKAAAANGELLGEILRKQWGFPGYVVTDCYAIKDIYTDHGQAKDAAEASALAIKAGTDLECGSEFGSLRDALERKLMPETALDQALVRLFLARFALGMFDPPAQVPFAQIPYSKNDAPEHRALARRAALESLVLLENRGALPIAPKVKKLALIGPTANDVEVLLGNYHGTPSAQVTIQSGLERACQERGVEFRSTLGSNVEERSDQELEQAEALAGWADLVVLALGITPKQEGEEGESKGHAQGDRLDIALPAVQQELFARVRRANKPIAVVLTGGSAQALGTIGRQAAAVLVSWYSGEEGGTAIADVLFGEQSPAGRLPVTFYASSADLPPFADYSMDRRTYRYFRGEPSWGFGYGKSYTTFRYQKLELSTAQLDAGAGLTLQVDVENVGTRAGDEVVQVYVTDEKASVPVPIRSLVAFQRIHLERGERQTLKFELTPRAMSIVLADGTRVLEPGRFQLAVGGRQPGPGSRFESDQYGLESAFEVGGTSLRLPN
jgi:beta-glucosidase